MIFHSETVQPTVTQCLCHALMDLPILSVTHTGGFKKREDYELGSFSYRFVVKLQ